MQTTHTQSGSQTWTTTKTGSLCSNKYNSHDRRVCRIGRSRPVARPRETVPAFCKSPLGLSPRRTVKIMGRITRAERRRIYGTSGRLVARWLARSLAGWLAARWSSTLRRGHSGTRQRGVDRLPVHYPPSTNRHVIRAGGVPVSGV